MAKTAQKSEKRPPHEKPVSFAGTKFKDVLKALLQTKPMPKEDENKSGR